MIGLYRNTFLKYLQLEQKLSISDWAAKYRYLPQESSSEYGKWTNERTPFLVEIMDCLGPTSPYKKVVFKKGVQIGASELGNNFLCCSIDQEPGPFLLVQPTIDLAKRYSKQRIAPTIRDTPKIRPLIKEPKSRDTGNTLLQKDYPGGTLIITGANAAAGLRSMPVRYLMLDEVDAYPLDIEGEGSPINIAVKRTSTYANRKIYVVSTPTIDGLSHIDYEYKNSDQRKYYCPCPYCGKFQLIDFDRIRYDVNDEFILQNSPKLKCDKCEKLIPERAKTKMLANGEWRKSNPKSNTAGFWINSLYSPLGWLSWVDIVEEFLEYQRSKDPIKLKTFRNTILGETWSQEIGETIDWKMLRRRAEFYDKCPKDIIILTAGIDVHDNRLEIEIVGWCEEFESYSLRFEQFFGNVSEKQVWLDMEDFLRSEFVREDGVKLKIAAACVDSGDNTILVYDWIKKVKNFRLWAIKGFGGFNRAPISRPSGRNKYGVNVFPLGVDVLKENFFSVLRISSPGPSFCHFPMYYSDDYFKQLTAEKLVKKYKNLREIRSFKKIRDRNEALDCRIYAYACLQILKPNLPLIKKRLLKSLN